MKITYIQRNDGDPVETQVKGFHFRAGAETNVDDPEVIGVLAGNPWFLVEGLPMSAAERDNRDPTPSLVYPKKPTVGRPRKTPTADASDAR